MIEKQEDRREVARRNVRLAVRMPVCLSVALAWSKLGKEDPRGMELDLDLDVESILFLPSFLSS